ncbi:MAG: 50S ribosomal protein L17 [Elusimicrobia bacterium]|nr:50S ribosomal protein L17 [Elusimicrobiota bacterium]
MIKTLGGRKLGVTGSHRRAMLRNMATSLFLHEKVMTTITKAKELRPFAEKIITHAVKKRQALVRRDIQDKKVFRKLLDVLGPRYAERPGGYTRIVRLGARPGDNAQRGIISLVT